MWFTPAMILDSFVSCMAVVACAGPAIAQQTVGGIAPEPGVAVNAWASGGGPLKGRVVGPDGSPMASVRVVWMVSPTDTGAARTTPARAVGEVRTGADGRFVFANAAKLAAKGVAHIVAITPKGLAATKDGQVRPGRELVLPLPLQTRLNLTFQKSDGKPAGGASVSLMLMVPASRQSWPCPLNDGKPFKAGSDGRLVVPAIPAAMRIKVVPGGGARVQPPFDEVLTLRKTETNAPPVRLLGR